MSQIIGHLELMAAAAEAQGLLTPAPTQDLGNLTDLGTASVVVPIDRNTTTASLNTQEVNQPPRKRKQDNNKKKTKSKKSKNTLTNANLALDSASEDDEPPEKYASTGLSDTVVDSLLNFHEEMETLIAIKALELGITVSDIERVFGKYVGVRRPSAWNRFLQSLLARTIFKEARGVGNGKGMKALSQKWRSMTPKEKSVYKNATQEAEPAELQNLDGQLQVIGVGSQSRHSLLQPCSNIVANPKNVKQYKEKATAFVEETIANSVSVAKSNPFELVIIAILTHIYKHNFQITRSTIGIEKEVKMIYRMDGVNDFPARLQGLLVGQTASELKASITESGCSFKTRVVSSLSGLLFETTKLRNWPWSKCNATLNDAGFELKLLPGARSLEKTFKEPSSNLNRPKLLALKADLKEKLIQLVRIDRNPRFKANPPTTSETGQGKHSQQIDPSLATATTGAIQGGNHNNTPILKYEYLYALSSQVMDEMT
ncbi:hypothetical protein DFH28DRAFT_1227738 [Melampsora americana]|nr:hypothetical protein DFH28DRAFT_1227738 [Melampsora americana]